MSIFLQDNCGSSLSLPTSSSAAHVVIGILCFRSIRPSTECCHISTSERVCTVGLLSHHLHFLSPYSLLDHLMKELLSPFFLEICSCTTPQTVCPGAFRSSLVIKLVIEGVWSQWVERFHGNRIKYSQQEVSGVVKFQCLKLSTPLIT